MPLEQYKNSPIPGVHSDTWTTLAAGIDASVTTITVASAVNFPSSVQYRIKIGTEFMLVTGGAGTTTWTVTRGIEGTTAAAHSLGDGVAVYYTDGAALNNPLALTTSGDIPYLNASLNQARLPAPSNGVYAVSWTAGVPSWVAASTGTVTSVAMTAPALFSVAGSPVTTTGALALSLATQNANLIFGGPATGVAAAPTFRSLVAADIPSLPYVPTPAPTINFATGQGLSFAGPAAPITMLGGDDGFGDTAILFSNPADDYLVVQFEQFVDLNASSDGIGINVAEAGSGQGGNIIFNAGAAAAAAGGGFYLNSGASLGGQGGFITLTAANGTTKGGELNFVAGNSTVGGDGGEIQIRGGDAIGGIGGSIVLLGGTGTLGNGIIDLHGLLRINGTPFEVSAAGVLAAANLTLANNFITSGNFSLTLTQTGITNVTLPTTGTLATLAGTEALSNKTLTTPTIASFANATHPHTNAAGGGQLAEGALALTDITTNNATASAHGFLPKLSGNASDVLKGDGTFGAGGGGGDALVANPLSQFAATTSLQLLGVISDETGTGALVFANTPTLVTPVLGAATGTSVALTSTLTTTRSIAATSTDGVILQNTTAAANGAQQWSPRLRLTGQGWKTTATAASQAVDWVFETVPVQGAANPTSYFKGTPYINGVATPGFYNSPMLVIHNPTTTSQMVWQLDGGAPDLNSSGFGVVNATGVTGFFRNAAVVFNMQANGIAFSSGSVLQWTSGAAASSITGDLILGREAAATLQMGADVNGAAVTQTFKAHDGITGTNIAGASLILASGRGTGSGTISTVLIQTPTVLGSGTTAQSVTTRVTVDSSGLMATGYKSSDGSAGVTAGPFTTITAIEVKNGLVVALTGS